MSHKLQASIFCIEMVKSKNYINTKGEHPFINSLIKWNNIVFDNKGINKDEWFFRVQDINIITEAKRQWEALKYFNDEIFILE
jgi:hypothetical protein